MIEIRAGSGDGGEIATMAEFFSFGTNDLTQTTFGISRDDAEAGLPGGVPERGPPARNPFATLDPTGWASSCSGR